MNQTRKQRSNWLHYTIPVLICLMLIVPWQLVGLSARYRSTANGEASARVATFQVAGTDVEKESISVSIAPGEQEEYSLEVENLGETAVTYTIVATNETENLPLVLTLTEKDGDENLSSAAEASASSSAQLTGALAPGENTANTVLTIAWDQSNNKHEYHREIDRITIQVTCTQLD